MSLIQGQVAKRVEQIVSMKEVQMMNKNRIKRILNSVYGSKEIKEYIDTDTVVTQQLYDNVNHPHHYASSKVECIDALESATKDLKGIEAVCTANAIKYLWRWKDKNGTEDLKKAQWYINKLIEVVNND